MKLFAALIAIGLVLNTTLARGQTRLQGGGATFPNPLYQRWLGEFQKIEPTVQVDYQAIGSGGGVKGITDKTIDFAGSDAPLTQKELAALGGPDQVVQIPTTAGAVVIATNLPNGATPKLTGAIVAAIFLGEISKWNDPAIAAINGDLNLPDLAITPVYRTDGSGTTFVFTSYLTTQSDDFRDNVGVGKQVKWPIGQGGKGSDGVTAVIRQTPGAMGYIEQAFADQNQLAGSPLQNAAGHFVKASPISVSAAAAAAANAMSGSVLATNIWNAGGEGSYPIASFTYLIIYRNLDSIGSPDKAAALAKFLEYSTGDGQKLCEAMDYAPLPPAVLQKVKAAIQAVKFQGQSVTR